ncbi:hypothetical protein SNOG_06479 [Parastagonospora nodorum SN15]|nr:hypothetical protein SNOG_06479 [Parastagonospora nodorum SN15]EAT86310.1 hypothetical protein SNOG_06479 [Parastagonospora nodorum SN15]
MLMYACLPMKMDWILNATGPQTESTWETGTACGYFLNATSTSPVLMSGYRVSNDSEDPAYGEALLMRTLPLVTNPSRQPLYGGSINFKSLNHPILDALIVSSQDGSAESVYRKETPIAHECVLSWCIKTIRSSYSWGVYHEDVEETIINTTRTPYPWTSKYIPHLRTTDTDYHGNISIYNSDKSQDKLEYGLSNSTVFSFVTLLDEIFPSSITVANETANALLKIRTSFNDRVMFRAVRFSPWLAPNNVTHHMERMATALTNAMRSDSSSREFMEGDASALETFVKVNWAWLAFPLAMLVLCVVFLVATMLRTSRGENGELGIWKTSAMPTLMYSLPRDMRHDLTKNATWRSEESGGAKRVRIRLLPDQGWRVSGYMCTSPTSDRRNRSQAPPGWV